MNNYKYVRCGSMWVNDKGWISIKIEGTFTKADNVYAFENKHKKDDKSPKYTLHIKNKEYIEEGKKEEQDLGF